MHTFRHTCVRLKTIRGSLVDRKSGPWFVPGGHIGFRHRCGWIDQEVIEIGVIPTFLFKATAGNSTITVYIYIYTYPYVHIYINMHFCCGQVCIYIFTWHVFPNPTITSCQHVEKKYRKNGKPYTSSCPKQKTFAVHQISSPCIAMAEEIMAEEVEAMATKAMG